MERAINYEIDRQIDVLESGSEVIQETRLYDSVRDETRSMRSKEEANDYRYFPDPDLLPLEITAQMIDKVRATLPELPDEKRQRFIDEYGLSDYDAGILTTSREMADYFEQAVRHTGGEAKLVANWVMGELAAALNKQGIDIAQCPLTPERFGGLLKRIADKTISGKIAKQVFDIMWSQGKKADEIIEAKGLKQITDASAIEAMVDEIIASSAQQVEQYRAGKRKVFGYFVGQVMKRSKGKANPKKVNEILQRKLKT